MSESPFTVETRNGWSWVVGSPVPVDSGPWRYRWEAQDYADELNRVVYEHRKEPV
jgi:hypothetical protein